MLRVQYILMSFLCCFLLVGCGPAAPDGNYSKLVYSALLPTEKDKVDVWSEDVLANGVLVKADKAIFWVDASSRVFALNKQGIAITDSQSGVTGATPQLLQNINRALAAAGKKRLNAQGGWKLFKWNDKK